MERERRAACAVTGGNIDRHLGLRPAVADMIGAMRNAPESNFALPEACPADPVLLLACDMGHVFVDFSWDEVCAGFMAKKPELTEADVADCMSYLSRLGYELGKISTEDFVAELNRKLGLSLSIDEFRDIWNLSFSENSEMADLLQSLSRKIPLYLISNTNEEHWRYLQSTYDVARHFQELILSFEVGHSKSEDDSYIFLEITRRSGLEPKNILLVDDTVKPNIEVAGSLGFQVHSFTNIELLKKDLNRRGMGWSEASR